jgi:hypothetical protein
MIRWLGACSTQEREILVGKPERKRPLGRLARRWGDNIIMDLRMGSFGLNSSVSG